MNGCRCSRSLKQKEKKERRPTYIAAPVPTAHLTVGQADHKRSSPDNAVAELHRRRQGIAVNLHLVSAQPRIIDAICGHAWLTGELFSLLLKLRTF